MTIQIIKKNSFFNIDNENFEAHIYRIFRFRYQSGMDDLNSLSFLQVKLIGLFCHQVHRTVERILIDFTID